MTAQNQPYFVGGYVHKIVDVLVASALSRTHALLIGEPGCGKTDISDSLAKQWTNGNNVFIRCHPDMPPEAILGAYDPGQLLQGNLVMKVDGTPYDPVMRIAVLDEINRTNKIVQDALLDTTDRRDTLDFPVVWGTANWWKTDDRNRALVSRFNLWHQVVPDEMDARAIVRAQLLAENNGGMRVDMAGVPDWVEVEEIRATPISERAMDVVGAFADQLAAEAHENGRKIDRRRVAHWSKVLARMSVWKTGTGDFGQLPNEAAEVMRYCYPAPTMEEAASWEVIAASVYDQVGAAIESAKIEVRKILEELRQAADVEVPALNRKAGDAIQAAEDTLIALTGGREDQRVNETVNILNLWLMKAVRREELE
jgi:MoxR-like ATPase